MSINRKLILASTSPRRREILAASGYTFECMSPGCDENAEGLSPSGLVCELSRRKAAAVLSAVEECVVISADTVVSLDGLVLGKPVNEDDARKMLSALSGKTHSVFTGYTVSDGKNRITRFEETKVSMRNILPSEIDGYIATKSPLDKAGAYGIQDAGGMFVSGISGDWYSVMGLPLCAVSVVLRENFGIIPDLKQ